MKRIVFWLRFVLCLVVVVEVTSVDRGNFKTCQQSSFCRRCRAVEPGKSLYVLHPNTLRIEDSTLNAEIQNTENLVKFRFQLFALVNNTFRMKINEWAPLKPRYEVEHALVGEPQLGRLHVVERTTDYLLIKSGSNKVKIFTTPFQVELYSGDQLQIIANARGLMRFEHLRTKPEKKENEGDVATEMPDDTASDPGAWEENFKSHHDTKPNGPTAVAMDFTFVDAHYVYGIPEHADAFALKSTRNTDPYRLYNLDVFEYELDNGMALYGSVPILIGHGSSHTAGVFWLNAAETWVDVVGTDDQNVVSSIVNFVSRSAPNAKVETHFMSESGIIDIFFMLGPQPKDVFYQYSKLTGTAPLPQYFSLAYHQCRWNYNDQDDVRNVDAKFDEYDIPMDVMWLDIEHTDGKKYFTWDKVRFPNPTEMITNLTAKGRKMVAIVDPHIKRDGSYFLHNDAEANNYYIKNKDGKDFEGWCWPGSSSYLDFFNPAVREYYIARYSLENYHGSTLDLYIWNDMNEPSVFNGPEITLHKDVPHFGGWEHRDVHNIYGLLHTKCTYDGLLQRSGGKLRPFVLTRAHFAGSQRYTAVWTGDNTAEWGHLRISIPMCLSLSVAGISFCGADVGGFFKNPDAELFVRWYQAAAFQPFFRTHAHIDTKRREPWLFDESSMLRIREAIRKRYTFLPYWYSLFYEHEKSGVPVMRPLWVEFPKEINTFGVDNEYMLGNALLVHPVTEPGITDLKVYFPSSSDTWVDIETYQVFEGGMEHKIPVTLDKVPVYQKSGTIVPKKERLRRSSALTHDDPYTLVIVAAKNGTASGVLYIDDGQSYDYRNGKFLLLSLNFDGNKLTSSKIDRKADYETKSWLERVIIIGINPGITSASVESKKLGKTSLKTHYENNNKVLTVRKPGVSMRDDWTIVLQ